jgi:NTE family protein
VDKKERRYFMNLPTSFVLSEEEVDKLRDLGGRLLREAPGFRDLIDSLQGATTPAQRAALRP